MTAPPKLLTTLDQARIWRAEARTRGESVVIVPTMGALHDGHIELVRTARAEGGRVVVSIFVNPTQFGPNEDFEAYPRTLAADVEKLQGDGCCDAVFAPAPAEMYPFGTNRTWVNVDYLGDHLCGAARPGHFKGVTTIVARFFTILTPDVAIFGLKDAQQFFILKRMTEEMGFATRLLGPFSLRWQPISVPLV
jgi:pantoate--beta-alanine ligase